MTPETYWQTWALVGAGSILALVALLSLAFWILGPRVFAKGMQRFMAQERR